jgi:hypothetical protein
MVLALSRRLSPFAGDGVNESFFQARITVATVEHSLVEFSPHHAFFA